MKKDFDLANETDDRNWELETKNQGQKSAKLFSNSKANLLIKEKNYFHC